MKKTNSNANNDPENRGKLKNSDNLNSSNKNVKKNTEGIKEVVMIETKIYVGLNDSVSRSQKFDIEKYVRVLKSVCKNYCVPFSFVVQEGGYMHEDGEYTQEKSIVISLIDVKKELINEIVKELCSLFRQESVLITEEHVRSYYVSEKL